MIRNKTRFIDLFHPAFLIVFAAICVAWLVAWQRLDPDTPWLRTPSRYCGYLAATALFVRYVHILRRWWLNRHIFHLRVWMQMHLAGAYLALLFALVHTRAHANTFFTALLLAAFWIVMLSGVIRHYGRMLLYRMLRLNIRAQSPGHVANPQQKPDPIFKLCFPGEEGPMRLKFVREQLLDEAVNLAMDYAKLSMQDIAKRPNLYSAMQRIETPLHRLLLENCSEEQRTRIAESCAGLTGESKLPPPKLAGCLPQLVNTLNDLLIHGDFSKRADVQSSPQSHPDGTGSVRTRHDGCNIAWSNRLILERHSGGELPSKPDLLARFCMDGVKSLERRFHLFRWLFIRSARSMDMPLLPRAREIATADQMELIDKVQALVEKRSELDRETCFHVVAHAWLLVHGPFAWFLFVLVVLHIIVSVHYSGF